MVRVLSYFFVIFIAAIFVTTLTFNVAPNAWSSSGSTIDYVDSNDNAGKGSSVHYGVIIDAGSSGSRVFVYVWSSEMNKGSSDLLNIKPLIDEETGRAVVKKVSPGLSSYGDNTTGAVTHAVELLDYAGSKIPKHKHKETSLFLMATAGMRLLPESQQNAILKKLREELPKSCDFIILDQHIEIISGKWEGIYSWIAVNYALNRFDQTKLDPALEMSPVFDEEVNKTFYRKPTVGMIDMGGGSVQIAFETTEQVPRMEEHMTVDLNLGYQERDILHRYKIYVTTFLGFGANTAIAKYEKRLATKLSRYETDRGTSPLVLDDGITASPAAQVSLIKDPCLPVNLHKTVSILDDSRDNDLISSQKLNSYARKGVGNFDQCQIALKELLGSKACRQAPCSFDGVYQPNVNFSTMEFYGFSEYWYTTNDVLDVSGSYSYARFRQEASKFCATKWSTLKRAFEGRLYPKADAQRMRTQCFKAAWVSTILHDGFGVPRNTTKFKTVSQINNEEVQWTIGALLYRMRHFPLREIQKLRESQLLPPRRYKNSVGYFYGGLIPSDILSQLLLLSCFIVVILAGTKYVCVLRRYKRLVAFSGVKNGGGSNIPRNRSMFSYMMLDERGMKDTSSYLQGIRVEKSSYIY